MNLEELAEIRKIPVQMMNKREVIGALLVHIDAQATEITDLKSMNSSMADEIDSLSILPDKIDRLTGQIEALKEKLLDARRTLAVKYPSDFDSPKWEEITEDVRKQLAEELKEAGVTWK